MIEESTTEQTEQPWTLKDTLVVLEMGEQINQASWCLLSLEQLWRYLRHDQELVFGVHLPITLGCQGHQEHSPYDLPFVQAHPPCFLSGPTPSVQTASFSSSLLLFRSSGVSFSRKMEAGPATNFSGVFRALADLRAAAALSFFAFSVSSNRFS